MPPRPTFRATTRDSTIDLRLASLTLPALKGPSVVPRKLTELSSMVKKRIGNRQSEQTNSRGRTREWLIGKGVDLQGMTEHLADASTRSSNRQISLQYSRGSVEPLLMSQTTYLKTEVHYQLHKQYNESRISRNSKVRLHNKLLAVIYPKEFQPLAPAFSLAPPISLNQNASLKAYANCYVAQVKKKLTSEKVSPRMWARAMADCADWRVWRILEKQLKGVTLDMIAQGAVPTIKHMLINSLRVVEEELEE